MTNQKKILPPFLEPPPFQKQHVSWIAQDFTLFYFLLFSPSSSTIQGLLKVLAFHKYYNPSFYKRLFEILIHTLFSRNFIPPTKNLTHTIIPKFSLFSIGCFYFRLEEQYSTSYTSLLFLRSSL